MLNSRQIENFKRFLDSGTIKAEITQVVLITIAIGLVPIIATSGVAIGNGVKIFKVFNKRKVYKDTQIRNAVANLRRNKFIEHIYDRQGVSTVRITKKGESKLKSFSIDILEIKKPKKWDGKWRVVMFDLPIKYKKVRDSFRFKLKQIGFIQLQKSVWVYPYPCTDELLFIADYYKVEKYIEILIVEEILNDKKLLNIFSLR